MTKRKMGSMMILITNLMNCWI